MQFSYSKPPQFEEIPPEFVEKPKPVAVPEFEPLKIEARITGTEKFQSKCRVYNAFELTCF